MAILCRAAKNSLRGTLYDRQLDLYELNNYRSFVKFYVLYVAQLSKCVYDTSIIRYSVRRHIFA
jgi:hypothetical protein